MPQPYVVRVDLSDPARPQAACDCGSYKQPCKYALGLILLAGQRPDLFAQDASTVEARRLIAEGPEPVAQAPAAEARAPADVGEALLQAILADPEDDGPRLIYADWLEENGNADRAEFIRVQIELAGTAQANPRRLLELHARETQLWDAHREEWLHGFPAHMRRRDLRFHKGFFEELAGDPAVWRKHCEKLFARNPIYRVRLDGLVGAGGVSGMAVLPHLANIRVLVLTGCRFTQPINTLQILFGTPFLTALRRVDLSGCALGSREVGLLASTPGLARAAEVDLSNNGVGLKGAEYLAGPDALPGLRELSLANNPLTDAGAKALGRSPHLDRLTRLDLRGVVLGEAARAALRERFGERVVFA
jgi:uncharacterized protein (TIGR02996 family)